MTNLQETATWEPHITQIELGDDVEGGLDGIDNVPHRQLANRVFWLKGQLDALSQALSGKAASAHNHALGDVSGLQAALDALSQALNGKAASTHGHSGADVTYADGSASYTLSVVNGVLTQTRL